MDTAFPWAGRIDPDGVCNACGTQGDCILNYAKGLLCFACGWEYLDPLFMGQYLLWKELRAVRLVLEHPMPRLSAGQED